MQTQHGLLEKRVLPGRWLRGRFHDVAQQVVNVQVARFGAVHETVAHGPAVVAFVPQVVEFFLGEQVGKREFQLGHALHVAGNVVEAVGQAVAVFHVAVNPSQVCEEAWGDINGMIQRVLQMPGDAVNLVLQRSVGQVNLGKLHEVAVFFVGALVDVDVVVEVLQPAAEELHALLAAVNEGGVGLYAAAAGEHFGKSAVHALGDAFMLASAQTGEFAGTACGIGIGDAQLAQGLLSQFGEHAGAVGLLQDGDGFMVSLVGKHIARTVPAVVTDVKRFVAFGRLA